MTVDIPGIVLPKHSPEFDPSTLSNYTKFDIVNTDLYFDINFDQKILVSNTVLELKTLDDIEEVVLDVSFIKVNKVKVNGQTIDFVVGDRVEPLGSALTIPFKAGKGEDLKVDIDFETTQQCTALQFLEKEATDGKKYPYLFSQSEAIHARSLFPCFDTPGIKGTYNITVKSPLNVIISGRPVSQKGDIYKFIQPIPIPSYLVAIASGDIEYSTVGPRSKVYTEPINLKRCHNELTDDIEKFIEAAEKIVFNYEWMDYNVLILPSSFPYGGMEVPNVTFATPTIITGDKSNIDVIAHELAHSWAGNLVTNCSWEHFWLNEGWCVYLERRIIESVHDKATRDFHCIIGWYDLSSSIKSMDWKYTSLVHDLKDGSDPDDAFSVVPYEKGSTLLYHLETILTKEVFDPFIVHYFDKFKYKSLDSYQFLTTLYDFFPDHRSVLDTVNWKQWLFEPGMPPIKPNFDTSLVDSVYKLSDQWFNSIKNNGDLSKFSVKDISSFSSNQSTVFLESLIEFDKHEGFKWSENLKALEKIDQAYGVQYANDTNAEILSRYYFLQVGGGNLKYFDVLGQWLGTVGRMKFVRPGFVTLNDIDHDKAVEYFNKFKSNYHPICQQMVKKDLGL
ncbi:leucine aminopeptidase 2 [[Candida] jaroonii]|uniref:Leucine aminopeptidase 2 n=1 Tax=[Candida] jaroonii TaxID=467808 RepID=A0ACA9Y9E1_9ASCO|nr:leucine aminopeptidase 2 [[Candida] jaroonii]